MKLQKVMFCVSIVLLSLCVPVVGIEMQSIIYYDQNFNPNDQKQFSIFCDLIQFDYYEPYIPEKVYNLKLSPDIEFLELVKQSLLTKYFPTQRHLKNLNKYKKMENFLIPGCNIEVYDNGNGRLVFNKYYSKISFDDNQSNSVYISSVNYSYCRTVAEQFINDFGGGLKDFQISLQRSSVLEYHQYHEGIKITGILPSSIQITIQRDGKISTFDRIAYKYDIINSIPSELILSATETVQLSIDSLIKWYHYKNAITLNHPNLVYLKSNNDILLAWEFHVNYYIPIDPDVLRREVIYLDALKGGVIYLNGLLQGYGFIKED